MSQRELAACDVQPIPGSPAQEKHGLPLWKCKFKQLCDSNIDQKYPSLMKAYIVQITRMLAFLCRLADSVMQ